MSLGMSVINGRMHWVASGSQHSVRVHDTQNPWLHRTVTVQHDGSDIHYNKGSLIKFLRTTQEGKELVQESLLHRICSCLGTAASENDTVIAAWNSYKERLTHSDAGASQDNLGIQETLAEKSQELCNAELHLIANQPAMAIEWTNEADERSYAIWCDPLTHIITIMALPQNGAGEPTRFATIHPDHSIVFTDPNQDQAAAVTILEGLVDCVSDIKDQQERLSALSTRFNPDCLRLLYLFFSGPSAANLRYREGEAQKSAMTLSIEGTDYRVWVRIGDDGRYYFNVQDNQNYQLGNRENKIGICLSPQGEIVSVYIDGAPASLETFQQALFDLNGVWNLRMTQILNEFLFGQAFQIEPNRIRVHAMTLQQIPDRVASMVFAQRPHGLGENANINFLQDTFEPGQGIDAGGPTQEFISLLSRHLLDGAPSRAIRMSSGLPTFQDNDACRESLRSVGRLFGQCIQHERHITGRLLPDRYFSMLQYLSGLPNQLLTNEQKLHAIHLLLEGDASIPEWMREHATGNPQITEEHQEYIDNVLMWEMEDGDYHKIIQDNFLDTYDSVIAAACHVVEAIPQAQRQQIAGMDSAALSTQIQGHAFNRELIANRIETNWEGSREPVVVQKVAWLKEHIRNEDTPQDWVEQFLKTVTGQKDLCGAYPIRIQPSRDHACHAHTCFRSIELPTVHTNIGSESHALLSQKELFLNNLQITMDQSGYDGA